MNIWKAFEDLYKLIQDARANADITVLMDDLLAIAADLGISVQAMFAHAKSKGLIP